MNAPLRFRAARLAESKAIAKLDFSAWGSDGASTVYDVAEYVRFGRAYVAVSGAKIVGLLLANYCRDGGLLVADLVVDPAFRGRGIAQRLYACLFRDVKGRLVRGVVSQEYPESLALHKKLGFCTVHKSKRIYGFPEKVWRYVVERRA